jgi:hypothetical protein
MKLYKYMTLERGIQVLGDGLLRFTQPTAFNDPFELNPSFDLMSKADLAALPNVPDKPSMKYLTPEALQSMFAAVKPGLQTLIDSHAGEEGTYSLPNNDLARLTLDKKYGVICLTESPENLLMWSHYGRSHYGVALQFDTKHPFLAQDKPDGELGSLAAVEYSDERPILSHSTLHSPLVLYRKSNAWAYEKEWRLLKLLGDADEKREATPFPIFLFKVPFEAITGIVLGVNMSHEQRVQLMQLCQREDLKHVEIFQTRLSDAKYELEMQPSINGQYPPEALQGIICTTR